MDQESPINRIEERMKRVTQGRAYIIMVMAAVFWSGAFITGKLAIREFPAFSLTFFRFLIALPFIFPVLYYRQPGAWFPTRRQWPPLILLGLTGTFSYHVLFFSCLHYTTAINSSLIGSTNPMVTTLLAMAFFHEKMTVKRLTGIVMSLTGVFIVITNADWQVLAKLAFNKGDLLMFGGVCMWAIYSVLSRGFMERYNLSPLLGTTYTFFVCTVVSLPFMLWENPAVFLSNTTVGGWLSILYMSIFASALGYLFQLYAIQHIGAPRAAIFVNLVPVFTIVQSVIILGESFTLLKLAGAIIIISGVYLATRPAVEVKTDRGA